MTARSRHGDAELTNMAASAGMGAMPGGLDATTFSLMDADRNGRVTRPRRHDVSQLGRDGAGPRGAGPRHRDKGHPLGRGWGGGGGGWVKSKSAMSHLLDGLCRATVPLSMCHAQS